MGDFAYVGTELDLFAEAVNWKRYLRRCMAPLLGREVLEVGAGFGGTTRHLCKGDLRRWVCLEPDPDLVLRLTVAIEEGQLPPICEPVTGTTEALGADDRYDSILYVDVLEHMADDRGELARAAGYLRPGGHLIVLSPAHQWLFSPFDAAIGHLRRYTRRTLRDLAPPGLELARLSYLDAFGLMASLGNRLLLRSALPTSRQIAFWDGFLVPWSSRLDGLFLHQIGKSVLCIWHKPSSS